MEDISATDEDSVIQVPNTISTPLKLQSLCSKILLMQENYLNTVEMISHNKINEAKVNTNTLSSNLAGRLTEDLNFRSEMVNNSDFCSENFNLLDINATEWINTKEYDNIIHELRTADHFPNLGNDISYLGDTLTNHNDTKDKTFEDEFIDYTYSNSKANSNLNNIKAETDDMDLIVISSSDDSESEFSLPNDIETISLSSIEHYENIIGNDEEFKVTLEISPHMQCISNFIEPSNKEETKQDLTTMSLSSRHPSSKTDKDFFTMPNSSNCKQDLDDSFCSGYNSSDFEFITEEDAKADGFIVNFEYAKDALNNENCVEINDNRVTSKCYQQLSNSNEDYRDNHQIPEGQNYFDLFNGIYTPTTPWMYENKSMGSPISAEYAGLGFDIGALSRQIREFQPDDEYKEEAEQCAKKILDLYPRENRKRRRRFY